MPSTKTRLDSKAQTSELLRSAPTEQMMPLAFEASPNGMVMANESGQIVLVNSATEKMFGYSRDALIGQPIELLIPEKFQQQHPLHRQTYFQQPKSRSMGQGRDLYGLHKSGREFPVEIGLNPIRTEQGLFVLAAIVDITDRKHAEEMMYLAVEASPNGMVMMDNGGKILLVNSTTEEMFDYSRSEIIGQQIEILVPQRFRKDHPKLRTQYFVDLKKRAMGQGRDLYGLRKNGEEFPVEIGLNPITTHLGSLVLAAIVDITERKRAEEMMRLAVEASPNGMILTDASGNVVMMNTTAELIFGYKREELTGKSISVLVPNRFQEAHPHLRQHYYNYPKARAMGHGRDLYGMHKSGREIPLEIGLNPINTNQGLMILASVVDITERKQQEDLMRNALKEKETMLAEIHHRVKNNLQIIDSLIGIQSEQLKDNGAIKVLMECQNRVKSMAIIHRTLYESQDFSRVNFEHVVATLVENLVSSYSISAEHIRLEINVKDISLPINISIPLGLIINELSSNVLKHAYPDGVSGSLCVSLRQEDKNHYRLEVVDEGRGIPDDVDIMEGNTLGLMLVQILSEQIDGELEIQNRNPTRFSLRFSESE